MLALAAERCSDADCPGIAFCHAQGRPCETATSTAHCGPNSLSTCAECRHAWLLEAPLFTLLRTARTRQPGEGTLGGTWAHLDRLEAEHVHDDAGALVEH